MKQTELIRCPNCKFVQDEDLYSYTDTGDMDGEFELKCSSCEEWMIVKFEFKPFVYNIGK